MVEVGGVEPPSETALAKRLRVYSAFDLAFGTPTNGLIRKQPLDYAGCGVQAENPAAGPARLCRCGLAGVRRATSGPLIRPRERNRCSQLQFFPFFNEANENPRRAIWSPRIPSKPDHPQVPLRKTARIIFFLSRPVKGDAEISEKTRFCILRRRPGLKMV